MALKMGNTIIGLDFVALMCRQPNEISIKICQIPCVTKLIFVTKTEGIPNWGSCLLLVWNKGH